MRTGFALPELVVPGGGGGGGIFSATLGLSFILGLLSSGKSRPSLVTFASEPPAILPEGGTHSARPPEAATAAGRPALLPTVFLFFNWAFQSASPGARQSSSQSSRFDS